jgi:hypothetical protein
MSIKSNVIIGQKSLQKLVDSIDIDGITSDEVLLTVLQKLSIDQRFDFSLDYLSMLFFLYSDKFDLDFRKLFKKYLNQTKIDDQFLSDTKTDELNIIEFEDHCDKSRLLHYLHTIHYEYLYKKSDLLNTTKTIINELNTIYCKDSLYTLNFIQSLY